MTVLSGDTLWSYGAGLVAPFHGRKRSHGMTYGCGPSGYDVRAGQTLCIGPGDFTLASTIELFRMPKDLIAFVHDKSTWARMGLAVQNTVIEPGWSGYLTLELTNHNRRHLLRRWKNKPIFVAAGAPIAQIVFHRLDRSTSTPYAGKYQNQQDGPQPAKLEKTGTLYEDYS